MTISKDSILYKAYALTHAWSAYQVFKPLKKLANAEWYDYHEEVRDRTSLCLMFWRLVGFPIWFFGFTVFTIGNTLLVPVGKFLDWLADRDHKQMLAEVAEIQKTREVTEDEAWGIYYYQNKRDNQESPGIFSFIKAYFKAIKQKMCPIVVFKDLNEDK
jgi:hypothetical protein